MKILVIALEDWGNSGYAYSRALQSAGHEVVAIKGKFHPFGYPEQMAVAGDQIPQETIDAADVLFVVHTIPVGVTPEDLKKKCVVVHHGGSQYRSNPDAANLFWNEYADATVIETPDLFGLGAKNETLVPTPVDTAALQPVMREASSKRLFIGHYPSDSTKKGSETVGEVLHKLKNESALKDRFEYEIGLDQVTWPAQIERMRRCDVYVDVMLQELWGKPYGEYGIAAREAAALGCVVVSAHRHAEVYADQYGARSPVIPANSAEELESALRGLILSKRAEVNMKQMAMREWVNENHSYVATGRRLGAVLSRALGGRA